MKNSHHIFTWIVVLVIISTSCDETFETDCFTACHQPVIVSADEYLNAPSDEMEIIGVQLEGNCLSIRFTSGGCDGNSWGIRLIDSEAIMESYPPQRNLRLSLDNEELCKAIVTKEVAFDVSHLRLEYDKILLNITNSGDQVLYTY